MTKVSIIMYHFVRDLKNSRFPEIKGLDLSQFKKQILYVKKNYTIIKMEDLIDSIKGEKRLPDNSLLLTFDDGYKDHYDFVFPILDELGIQGSFFPPAKAIKEHKVLDVNKIHFILASVHNKKQLIDEIYTKLDVYRSEYSLKKNESYYRDLAIKNRFDTAEVIFIKRILQKALPEKLRNIIVDYLFKKYVSNDEKSFSQELYMSEDQLKLMRRKGMYIGSHGFNHYWLNTINKEKQEKEIYLSLKFLKEIGCSDKNWVLSYPYGAYDNSLLQLLKKTNCIIGLTTEDRIADLSEDDNLLLPRLDTNDLPK